MQNIKDIIYIAGALVAISIPILYLIGFSYYKGYTEGFGLNSELSVGSIEDNLIYSLSAIDAFLSKHVTKCFLEKISPWIMIALCLMLGIVIKHYTSKNKIVHTFITKHLNPYLYTCLKHSYTYLKNRYISLKKFLIRIVAAWAVAFSPLLIIISIGYFFASLYHFHNLGTRYANRVKHYPICAIDKLLPNYKESRIYCVFLYDEHGQLLDKGHFVARSGSQIAIYKDGKVSIYQDGVQRIDSFSTGVMDVKSDEYNRECKSG